MIFVKIDTNEGTTDKVQFIGEPGAEETFRKHS